MTKMPVQPNGNAASSTDPATWTTFDEAMIAADANGFAGVGFVFTEDDPYFGVDLDECLDFFYAPCKEAAAIIGTFATYTEVSPSRAGVKLIGKGRKPGEQCRTQKVDGFKEVEIYDKGRFFTVTGNVLKGAATTITEGQDALDSLYFSLWPKQEAVAPRKVSDTPDDILDMIRRSRQGHKFDALWRGDLSSVEGDHSRGDAALVSILAWWCQGDAIKTDELFRRSALYREKWDSKRGDTTYGGYTIDSCIRSLGGKFREDREQEYDWTAGVEALTQKGEVSEFDAMIEAIASGRRKAIEWPWSCVSRLTKALMPGTITLLCGDPGASKSFLMLEAVRYWNQIEERPAIMELEDGREYHQLRILAQLTEASVTDGEWGEKNAALLRQYRDQHREEIDSIGSCIFEPPGDIASMDMLAKWAQAMAEDGRRVICIDPITMADDDAQPWVADKRFIVKIKRVAEDYGVSIVVVTHPKKMGEKVATKPNMDNLSGGAAYQRFFQTILWLESLYEPENHIIKRPGFNHVGTPEEVNRILTICKARNGVGKGARIGMWFDVGNLTFKQLGVILRKGEAE